MTGPRPRRVGGVVVHLTDAQVARLREASRGFGSYAGHHRLAVAVAELDRLSERRIPFVTGRLAPDRWSS